MDSVEQKPNILPDGRMTTQNAASYLGFSPNTLNMWRTTGEGPLFMKVKGRVFYRKEALDEWLQAVPTSKTTAQARIKSAWRED